MTKEEGRERKESLVFVLKELCLVKEDLSGKTLKQLENLYRKIKGRDYE